MKANYPIVRLWMVTVYWTYSQNNIDNNSEKPEKATDPKDH